MEYNCLYPDKKLIYLALIDNEYIGHYALMPFRINAFGQTVQSFFSLDSMIHPDYQGQKIFSGLMEYAHKEINQMNEPFITFLNEQSISIYTNKYNWQYLGYVPVYCRPLSLMNIAKKYKIISYTIKPIAFFMNKILNKNNDIVLKEFELFDERIESIPIGDQFYSLDRNIDFLNWRFSESPINYEKLIIIYNNDLIGYCVLRQEVKFGIHFTWIMDLALHQDYNSQYSSVLNAIAAKYLYCSDFITSLLPNNEFTKYFLKSGYFKIPAFLFPHKFYFCINRNYYNDDRINQLDCWYMSWALNDVI